MVTPIVPEVMQQILYARKVVPSIRRSGSLYQQGKPPENRGVLRPADDTPPQQIETLSKRLSIRLTLSHARYNASFPALAVP